MYSGVFLARCFFGSTFFGGEVFFRLSDFPPYRPKRSTLILKLGNRETRPPYTTCAYAFLVDSEVVMGMIFQEIRITNRIVVCNDICFFGRCIRRVRRRIYRFGRQSVLIKSIMSDRTCDKCGKVFSLPSRLKVHLARKTPCSPILDILPDEKKDSQHACKFCGRLFASYDSMRRHIRQVCKIAPRNGDTSGMEMLYEHILKKQEAKHKGEIESLRLEMDEKFRTMAGKDVASTSDTIESKEIKNVSVHANKGVINQNTKITKVTNKNKITINFFGSEKTDHITPKNVLAMVKKLGPLGSDLSKASDRLILSMAMMIFSDEKHPENITCYLPNKKGKEALVHDESGWSVSPISLTLSPMASRSVDELFKKQPWPGQGGIELDEKLDIPTQVLGYIKQHEGDLVDSASGPGSELRAIPIRNKEILERVLAGLPKAGDE